MHDRLVAFERILNFRDFGGWDAEDGKIARGVLFRSASFHDATEADIAKLDSMGFRFMVDLRRPEERTYEPNKWPGQATRVVFNEEGYAHALPPHLAALLRDDLTAESVSAYMHEIYRGFAFERRHIDLYRNWFHGLLSEGGPAIIHCAAGKDRTGLGCALTLLALGVNEDDVFADYEFTNQAVDIETRLPRIKKRMEERLERSIDSAALRPMLGVTPAYLRAALDEIETRHGGVHGYLADVLNVGARERETLRAKFVR